MGNEVCKYIEKSVSEKIYLLVYIKVHQGTLPIKPFNAFSNTISLGLFKVPSFSSMWRREKNLKIILVKFGDDTFLREMEERHCPEQD